MKSMNFADIGAECKESIERRKTNKTGSTKTEDENENKMKSD